MALTPTEGELLRDLHRNLGQEALEPSHPFYVDLLDEQYAEAFGEDVVAQLARDVGWSENGSVNFFSGFHGAGKSTQLNRLREELGEQGFAVAKFSVEDYLDVRFPITAVNLTFAMTAGIWDASANAGWVTRSDDPRSPVRRLFEWVKGIEVDPGDGAGFKAPDWAPADFEIHLRRDPTFRRELDRFLRERSVEFSRKANEFVGALEQQIRDGWNAGHHLPWQGLVVIVDSLDHARSEASFDDVRGALREVFDQQLPLVRFDRARTVFCVPAYLRIDGSVRRIVNIKVSDRSRTTFAPGVLAMRDLLKRRVPAGTTLDDVIAHDDVTRLIRSSGGHVRDLLRLVDEVIVRAQHLPASTTDVDRAIVQVRQGLLPIAQDDRERLAQIAKSHELYLENDDRWEDLAGLLDRHLVLLYPNEEPWYDLHPLIANEIDPGFDIR